MTLNFCTLFDSGYMDKGIVLYESLKKHSRNFKLYIFAFDDTCFNILGRMGCEDVQIISLKEFETPELLNLKSIRSRAEYCWTCTPLIIQYVFDNFGVDNCTYIDADMMFFADPNILIKEMTDAHKSVMIVKHNFPSDCAAEKEPQYGKYCVEFNVFLSSPESMQVLNDWGQKCILHCSHKLVDGNMGDQMYLDEWTERFSCVHVMQNFGGGIAPWNLDNYILINNTDERVTLQSKETQVQFEAVFFHFQNMKHIIFDFINLESGTDDKDLKMAFYAPYLAAIMEARKMLLFTFEEYRLPKNRITGKDPIFSFLQRYVRPFKTSNKNDIVRMSSIKKGRIYDTR